MTVQSDKNFLAITWSVLQLLPYFKRCRITVRMGYDSLCWILNVADFLRRLARWRLRFFEFDGVVDNWTGVKIQSTGGPSDFPQMMLIVHHPEITNIDVRSHNKYDNLPRLSKEGSSTLELSESEQSKLQTPTIKYFLNLKVSKPFTYKRQQKLVTEERNSHMKVAANFKTSTDRRRILK